MTSTNKNNPGCLASILRIFGIKEKEPAFENLPYRVRDDFLSAAELSFFHVLESVIEDKLIICAKVRLADIFFVTEPHKNFSYFNRISQRHVDFLLCQPDTLRPVFAIELDDASHNRSDRKERDDFVNKAFQAAKLPLVHIPAQRAYNTRDLATRLRRYLPAEESAEMQQPNIVNAQEETAQVVPVCPKCGAPMVLRTVKKEGEHQGKQFYGCSTFPKCRGILPL
jgi:hypothetical protein